MLDPPGAGYFVYLRGGVLGVFDGGPYACMDTYLAYGRADDRSVDGKRVRFRTRGERFRLNTRGHFRPPTFDTNSTRTNDPTGRTSTVLFGFDEKRNYERRLERISVYETSSRHWTLEKRFAGGF